MGSFWIAVHIFDKPSDDCPCPPACILVRPCFPWGEREKKSCKHFAKKKWVLTFIRRNDARLPGIKDTDPRPLRVKAANVRAQFQCQWPGFARLLCRLVARTRNCMQNEPGHAHTQLRPRHKWTWSNQSRMQAQIHIQHGPRHAHTHKYVYRINLNAHVTSHPKKSYILIQKSYRAAFLHLAVSVGLSVTYLNCG